MQKYLTKKNGIIAGATVALVTAVTAVVLLSANDIKLSGTYTKLIYTQSGTAIDPIIIDGQNETTVQCLEIRGNYIEVKNLIADGCPSHGIFISGKHIVVENTIVRNMPVASGQWGSGIKVYVGGEDIIIRGNEVYNNFGEGLGITRGVNVTVEDNTVYDNFSVNIYIDNSKNVTVKGNTSTCSNPTYYRDGNPASGILLGNEYYSGWGSQLGDVTIDKNRIEGCRPIRLYNPIGGVVSGIVITNNTFINVVQPFVSVAGAVTSNNVAGAAVNTYYVSPSGNDTNTGASSSPFKTVQKCMNIVKAGDTCLIANGTYNEALTLKTSGTASLPITVKCATDKGCTVNSSTSRALVTGGRVDYYVIDGLRFISNYSASDSLDGSLNFQLGAAWSRFSKTNGNHGFVIKNCYVEGNVHFYGHNNLIENCELNGMSRYPTGISDGYSASYDNTYSNNLIYNYTGRAIWSMESTDNILIEGNIIHDTWGGPDCDGAAVAVTRCQVIDNHIYNVGQTSWGMGVFLENCFDCLVQGNIIHDIKYGAGIYAINYGNGSSTDWHTYNNVEYRDKPSGMIVKNNLVYNSLGNGGLYAVSVNGMLIEHNTFWVGSAIPIEFRKETDGAGMVYHPINETITNNILNTIVVWRSTTTSGLVETGNFIDGDPLFVDINSGDYHLRSNSPACGAGAYPCGIIAITPTVSHTPTKTAIPPSVTPSLAPPVLTGTASVTVTRTPTATNTLTQTPTYCDPEYLPYICIYKLP